MRVPIVGVTSAIAVQPLNESVSSVAKQYPKARLYARLRDERFYCGAHAKSRTWDLHIISVALLPAELHARGVIIPSTLRLASAQAEQG